MSALSRPRWWFSVLLVLMIGVTLRIARLNDYPAGFHYDEAADFTISRNIAFYGAHPFPMFAAYNGREVFYYYVNALALRTIGESIFTARLAGAWMGWIAVAATIALGRAMFGERRGLIIGLLAGALFSVSFPQIFIARSGFRTIGQPFLQSISLWLIFAGLRRNHWRSLIAGGITGGAVLYTYQASRLYPAWVGLMLVVVVLADAAQRRRRLAQSAVILVVMGLVALPMVVYALNHQDIFMDRLDQLSTGEESPGYLESIWLHAKMFFIQGDPYLRYNEPLKPYFDPISGMFLLVGLGVSIWGALRERDAVVKSACVLAACAPLMVLPSILAVGGMPPSHMRSIGMVPMIFFLPALGMTAVYKRFPSKAFLSTATAVALLVMGGWVWNRFANWATDATLFYMSDGDMLEAGRWLDNHQDGDPLMYVTSIHYNHPTLQIAHLPTERLTYLTGSRVFLPPADQRGYLIETRSLPLSDDLRFRLDGAIREDGPTGPDGKPMFTVYRWEPDRPVGEPPASEPFGGWLAFTEADLPETAAGSTATIFSQWRILASPAYDDLTPIFQLETPYGDVLARNDVFTLGSTRWRTGETLVQKAEFDIPAGTPPGDYPVRVAWVGRAADQYVGRLDTEGHFAGIWLDIGTLTVVRPEVLPTDWRVEIPVGGTATNLGPDLRLLGWSALPAAIRPGESPKLDLLWQALTPNPAVGPLRIVATASDGQEIPLWEGDPAMGTYPFNQWIAGEIVMDRHRWRIPTDMPAGEYLLSVALGGEQVELGKITVLELNRQFDPPAAEHKLDLTFGDTVRLAGYDLAVNGAEVNLTLYWQSITQTDLPLTVFVHLAGPGGNVDQRDAQPRANSYPVSLWMPGEYVADTYTLAFPPDAPAGVYELRVGFYLQATGQRLSIVGPDGSTAGDYWTLEAIERP